MAGNFYYHFVGAALRDGSPIPENGEWLIHDGPLVMCKSGLHASRHPMDALQYAPGNTICLVELSGDIVEDTDKVVANGRKIVSRRRAEAMLRRFACDQALSVCHFWEMPELVWQYLNTMDESLRAGAWDAAWDAAWAAAWAGAWAAAQAAAQAAAWAGAWDAARDAAWAAAQAAAWDAARDDFQSRVNLLFEGVDGN